MAEPAYDSTIDEMATERQKLFSELGSDDDKPWPNLKKEVAYHGLIGDLVRLIEPNTESDPAAILVQSLVFAGACLGRHAYYPVEGDKHYPNLNAVLVGESSKGRKGTSLGQVRRAFRLADEQFDLNCIQSGLSSGEGLIWAVRDASENNPEDEPGIFDKRLLVAESEFAGLLRVMQREGNIISRVVRDAWDRGDLSVLTKKFTNRATGAHICIVGHITTDELNRYLDRTEAANGFANRFLYVAVKRSKFLPFGGDLRDADLRPIAERIKSAIEFSKLMSCVQFDKAAANLWAGVYTALSSGSPGMHGSVTGRAEAQVVRVALIYALLDEKNYIGVDHLKAALAVWDYADESAQYVFGGVTGDPVKDTIVKALKSNRPGLARTKISALFNGHAKADQISRALAELQSAKLAISESRKTNGRSQEIWVWI